MNGQELRKLRKQAGLTQAQIAKLMGTTYQTISKYEGPEGVPDLKKEFVENFYIKVAGGNDIEVDEEEYQKSEIINKDNRILLEILNEMKDLRRDFDIMKDDRENEKKQNDVLRKQLQLAINVLKSLDRDLSTSEKSTGTKQDFGKIK